MAFKIPFTSSPIEILRHRAQAFSAIIKRKRPSQLQAYLDACDVPITREDYLGIVLRTSLIVFLILCVLVTTLLAILSVNLFYVYGIITALLISGFVAMSQLLYPRVYNSRKQRSIERELIPSLEDMLVQLNSGIPLFSILVNISSSDYGELSAEFKKAVKKINTGMPQTDVLDEMGKKNVSQYFRRALWQISNGMKAGSDIGTVIRESLRALNEEQLLQIQTYGNKLNPLIMFYMLISVILPALSITFLTVVASLISLPGNVTVAAFIGLFVFGSIIQVMFLGIMKSIRPSLL